MTEDERHELEGRAAAKGLMDEYRQAIAGAHYYFGQGGGQGGDQGNHPPPKVSRGVRTIDIWLADLKALPSWRTRMAFLKEHAFPPADYMGGNGGGLKGLNLSIAYLIRGLRGSLRLFRRC
jgi:hypothetical protein